MSVFDAYSAYYDLLYRDKDYQGEATHVGELLRRHGIERGRVLELGCGTGRHASYLADSGFEVYGVDLSPSMIAQARERHVSRTTALQFVVGDVRSVRIGSVFDAAISLFHVVSYQTSNRDLDAVFRTAQAHLRKGGVFVFDFWYGPGVLSDRPVVRVKEYVDDNVNILRIARPTLFPNENRVDVDYTVLVTNKADHTLHRIEETHQMRYLFLPEIESLAQAHGMSVARSCGSNPAQPLGFGTWTGTVVAIKS